MKTEQGSVVKEFNQLYKEYDVLWHELALSIGLSDSALEILYSVFILGNGCMQKDICKMSYARKQTINSSIQKLEKDGMLRLKRGKRREMHICLTEKGQQFVTENIEPVVVMENRAFEEMTPAESRELLRLTKKHLGNYRNKVKELIQESK